MFLLARKKIKHVVKVSLLIGMFAIFASVSSASGNLSRRSWATKLPNGPLRLVFLAPYSSHLDSFELLQRFDIEGAVVPVVDNYRIKKNVFGVEGVGYWPQLCTSSEQVLENIRKALRTDWEVLVICAEPVWAAYPEDIRTSILSSIMSGKALITGNLENGLRDDLKRLGVQLLDQTVVERFPFSNTKEGIAKTYRCGKGRVVNLYCKNDIEYGYLLSVSPLQSEFEYSAARAGWLLRLAGRPEVKPYIESLNVSDEKLLIQTKSTSNLDGCFQIDIRRHDNYETILTQQISITPGIPATVELPYLPGGKYIAEVVVQDNNGATLDWDAVFFIIVRKIGLRTIIADNIVEAGRMLSCRLELDVAPIDNLQISARWYDNWNRLLVNTGRKPFSNEFSIEVPHGSLSVVNRLEITLFSDRGAEALSSTELLMPKNVQPVDFYVLYWHAGLNGSWRQRLYLDTLRRKGEGDALSNCGITTLHARTAALSHFRTVPYSTELNQLALQENVFNNEWLNKMEQRARDSAKAHKNYNALAYTLGDEIYINPMLPKGRFADSQEIWKAFQDYLKELYSDIEDLNKQWKTDFDNWKNIRFNSENDMLNNLSNPSVWVDYRMFINNTFASVCQRMLKAIKQEDTEALVGWDGTEQFSSYDGYDWWQLTRNMELINVYARYIVPGLYSSKIFNGQAAKSFRPSAKLSGGWMNSTDFRYGGEYDPWYLLLNGWNSVWWWSATFPHPEWGALQWNMNMTPVAKSMAQTANEIKKGPATLLARAEKLVDPIAIHYSENNFHASTLESGIGNHINNLGVTTEFWMAKELVGRFGRWCKPDDQQYSLWKGITPKGHYVAASKNFYLLLHDLGFQPRTVARQEIEADVLSTSGLKVLILPFVVSLSDTEVEKICKFVENGGLLIADYRCGVRDLHGRMRQINQLDDVFGIKRSGSKVHRHRQAITVEYFDNGATFESIFHEDITVLPETEVYGNHDNSTVAFLVHSYGKGKAIYLNSDLYSYDLMRKRSLECEIRELFRSLLLRLINLKADFVVEHKDGHSVSHTEVARFKDADNLYYGILPDFSVDQKQTVEVSLRFPEGRYVYDVRNQRYLGSGGANYRRPGTGQTEAVCGSIAQNRGYLGYCPGQNQPRGISGS